MISIFVFFFEKVTVLQKKKDDPADAYVPWHLSCRGTQIKQRTFWKLHSPFYFASFTRKNISQTNSPKQQSLVSIFNKYCMYNVMLNCFCTQKKRRNGRCKRSTQEACGCSVNPLLHFVCGIPRPVTIFSASNWKTLWVFPWRPCQSIEVNTKIHRQSQIARLRLEKTFEKGFACDRSTWAGVF